MSDLGAATRRGVGWSTVSIAGTAASGLLQLSVAARFLSRDDFGLMALILVVVGFSQSFSDLGTANAVLHRQRAHGPELDSLFWLSVAVGGVLFALVGASGPVFARLWHEPDLAEWLPLAAVVFLFMGAMQVPTALLRRELCFRPLAIVELSGAAASLVVVGALAIHGFGVLSLLAGQIAGTGVRCLGISLAARRLFRPRLHFDLGEVRPYLDFGIYQLGERLLNFAAWNLDKVVIGTWLGTQVLGTYSLAYQLVIRPFRFFAAVSTNVTRSVLARMQDDRDGLVRGYLTSVRLVALVAFPAYAAAFAVSDSLVLLVYGPGWGDAASLFAILWPLGALYAVGSLVGGLVVATGKVHLSFVWNLFAVLVHFAAILVGVRFGARGVALALVLATACVLFPCGFYLRFLLVRLRPVPFLTHLAPPFAYAAIMGVAVRGTATLLAPLPAGPKLAFAIGCGLTVYGALLWTRERALLLSLRGSRA